MKKTYAVIGLGRFGTAVAERLYALGNEVLVIDDDAERVQRMESRVTYAVVADARDEAVLRSLGMRNYDCAIVAIGTDLAASIVITMNLKELGVPQVVCKAEGDMQKRALEKIGAEKVKTILVEDFGVEAAAADELLKFIETPGGTEGILAALDSYKGKNEVFDLGAEELKTVATYMQAFGVPADHFEIDLTIARGLDYYTRTVFEVEAPGAGVGSIGGGGRYDGLVELEGGKPTAGVGFAVGFERALLALQAFGNDLGAEEAPCVYVANAGKELRQNVFAITQELRAAGIVTEADYQGRSLKAQFKQADKVGAKLILVLGGDELAAGKARLKDMKTGEQTEVALDDSLYTTLYNRSLDRQLADMTDLFSELAETGE